MKAQARREEIAAYVLAHGEVRIDDLRELFQVSRMTIHRHVEELARQGVLRKLHGAVSALPSAIYESQYRFRETRAQKTKAALARAALAEIAPGQSLLLDDSSTTAALLPHLGGILPLTLVTNSLGKINALTGQEGLDLIALGGDFHPTYQAFIGQLCERALSELRVNLAICSASAVSGTEAFIQDGRVTRVKQAMIRAAARRVLLVDSSKFGKIALNRFAGLSDFDAVYSDTALDPALAADLQAAGIPLTLVKTND